MTTAEYRQEIEDVFDKYALRNCVSTVDELKTMVNYALGRVDVQATHPIAIQTKKTFKEMIDLFWKSVPINIKSYIVQILWIC